MVHLLKETTMKFIVTACSMNRQSRVSTGKPRDEVIDTETNVLFKGACTALEVEKIYHAFWNDLNNSSADIVKVIGVRRKS